MIKFGYQGYETEFPNWSKHHKSLSAHVKRVYGDGEVITSSNEQLEKIVNANEDKLKSKHVTLSNRETGERREARDYFLPLNNLEYQEANLDDYHVGSSNTKQSLHIRLKFQIEDNVFYLEHSFSSSGHYATSFKDYLYGMDFVEDTIEEILNQDQKIEEVGIENGEDGQLLIAVADSQLYPDSFEIEQRELLHSLVGVELYKFDLEITD